MTDFLLEDASVTYPDWSGGAQLDGRKTAPGLGEVVGLDEERWLIVAFDIGGGEIERGNHRLSVYAIDRSIVPDESDVIPKVAAENDGAIPVTEFLIHDVDPYAILRAITHQFSMRLRIRGSRDLPIRVVGYGDVPEQNA